MSISNTKVLIKRSLSSNTPSSLLQGELAYSYSSNTLYIGSPAGTGALEIGSWSNLTNLTPGTYGSSTQVPVIQVDSHGKVTNVTTQAISTTLALSGDNSTTNTMSLLTGTLNFNGGQGITTAVLDSTANVTFNVDNTVVRANASYIGPQTINTNLTIGANSDLTVTGNLFVFGNTTTLNIDQFEIQDPLLLLGVGNYYSDTFDIGFASHYNDGQNAHTGLIRDAGTKEYHFFKGYTGELDANNNINLNDPSYREANVYASYFKGNVIATTIATNTINATGNVTVGGALVVTGDLVIDDLQVDVITANTLTLTNALTVPNGGTGQTSFTSGQVIVGSGVNGLAQIANITYTQTGTLATNNTITTIGVDAYGRFTNATVSAISGLTVPQGGTGLSTITQNGITYGNGTGNLGVTAAADTADQTWSNQILTVTNAGTPVWTTSLDGGQF